MSGSGGDGLRGEADRLADAQQVAKLRRELDRTRVLLRQRDEQLEEALGRIAILEGVDALDPRPPKWPSPKRPKSDATVVVAMLSDCHFDIQVRPEDVGGVNSYDRTVAVGRLRAWAEQLALLPKTGPAASIEGLVLLVAGDLVAGPIDAAHHVGADDTVFGTLLFWSEKLAAAVRLLAESFGRVHCVAVVGNHGRMTGKPRSHLAARDNLDWHLCHLVARLTHEIDGVSWQIGEALDAEFEVFGRRHLVTHGDQAKGGGGIGGIWPPIMRMVARKQQQRAGVGRPFDTLWMGHWHQATWGDNFVVNGSLIGFDAFAARMGFPVRPPEQVAALVTPGGVAWRTSVRVG